MVLFGHAAVVVSSSGFVVFVIVTCGNGFVIILAVVIDVTIGASVIVMFVVVVMVCSGTIMCHEVIASCYGHQCGMIFFHHWWLHSCQYCGHHECGCRYGCCCYCSQCWFGHRIHCLHALKWQWLMLPCCPSYMEERWWSNGEGT